MKYAWKLLLQAQYQISLNPPGYSEHEAC